MRLEERSALFAALADPIRLRVLDVLGEGRRCVCEVQEALPGVASNLLSYHLRVLREAGLVEGTRRGRWVDYEIASGERVTAALPRALGER